MSEPPLSVSEGPKASARGGADNLATRIDDHRDTRTAGAAAKVAAAALEPEAPPLLTVIERVPEVTLPSAVAVTAAAL